MGAGRDGEVEAVLERGGDVWGELCVAAHFPIPEKVIPCHHSIYPGGYFHIRVLCYTHVYKMLCFGVHASRVLVSLAGKC